MNNKKKVMIFVVLLLAFAVSLSLLWDVIFPKSIKAIWIITPNSESISINFVSGEISGEISENVKPYKEDLEEYEDYISKAWGRIKKRNYSVKSNKYSDTTRLLWQVEVTYTSGTKEKLQGTAAFPKEWSEIIRRTNKLIGKDVLSDGTEDFPLK